MSDREGEKESRERQNQNSPRVERDEEKRGERTEFDFGGNEVSADRGFASTTQHKQGVNALYQCLLIKSSLSRNCTNHGREPVE